MNEEIIPIILQARDQASAVINKVKGEIHGLTGAGAGVTGMFSRMGGAVGGLGGALGHLQGKVGMLLGATGIVGLGGAVFGLGEFLKDAIGDAENFGVTAGKLQSILGGSASNAQLFLAQMQHFDVDTTGALKVVGMLEKNLGNLTKTTDGAQKVYDRFGFSILDSSGKVQDAQTVIANFADYWNTTGIPTEQKVALATQLFGRQWQTLLPMFQAGKEGMAAAYDEAKQLGLGMDGLTAAAERQKEAARNWHTAFEALKIIIGADILPLITDLTKDLTAFVTNHQSDIREWFKKGIDMARAFVSFVKDQLLPTVGFIAGSIGKMWDAVPAPVKDLLVKGFVADKTIKFLFGIDPLSIGKNLLGDALGTELRNLFGRGSSPANPMFVADVAGAGGAGGVAGFLKGVGGGSLLAGVAGVGTLAGSITLAIDQIIRLPTLWNGVLESMHIQSMADFKQAFADIIGGSTMATGFKPLIDAFMSRFFPQFFPGTTTPPPPSLAPGYSDYGQRHPEGMPTPTTKPGAADWGLDPSQFTDDAAAVAAAADKIQHALSNMASAFQGTTGSSKGSWESFKKEFNDKTSVPKRIQELQGELKKFDQVRLDTLGPNALAAWITGRQGVQDELGKLQFFMDNHSTILAQALPNAMAAAVPDWQAQWNDILGISTDTLGGITDAAGTAGADAGAAWAAAYKDKSNYAYAFAPASGYVYNPKGKGTAPGAAPAPAGPTAKPLAAGDIAQALHTDLVAIQHAGDNVATWLRGATLATSSDIVGGAGLVKMAVDGARDAIDARLSALLSKVQPIFITIKPQPINIYMNSRLIAQQLTSERNSRYPQYTNHSGPRVD